MDYDFQTTASTLRIPTTAYRPVKRCPYCESVFINDKNCESCGRSMLYHPIGEPFGAQSFYGIKERYVEAFHPFYRFFPQFENKKSPAANSYVRKISKRFADLIAAFNSTALIAPEQRKLFYVESMVLIDELLRYEIHPQVMQSLLEENDNSLLGQELLYYLQQSIPIIVVEKNWKESFLEYRFWGLVRVDYCLKLTIITATVLTMAVKYKEIISSQFGK